MDWLLKKSTTVKVNFKLKVVSVESVDDTGDVFVAWKRGNKKVITRTLLIEQYFNYCLNFRKATVKLIP